MISSAAPKSDRDDRPTGAAAPTPVRACCCKVLMVSKGAKISLLHPAASALARLFLTPLTHAASLWAARDGATAARILLVAVVRAGAFVAGGDWRLGGRKDWLLPDAPWR